MAYINRMISERAMKTMLASLADSTIYQYTRPLRPWWEFCQQHLFPVFQPTPDQVLDFLVKELERVESYFNLNTSLSAVSLISHNEMRNDPLVKRFCKKAEYQKPPCPKYNHV